MMVLNDDGVDDYVNADISELNILEALKDPKLSYTIKHSCHQKHKFRQRMAQNVSLFRMDYMLRVIKKVFGKYNIAHPKGFQSKLRHFIKENKAKNNIE